MTTAYDGGSVPEIALHHRLRIARESAGLEQTELSEIIGTSRTSISAAENGKTAPRRILLNAWALATGVPVSWLITGIDPHLGPDDGGVSANSGLRIRSPQPARSTLRAA